MSRRARAKSVSIGYPVKVGTRYVSYYQYGHMLAESGAPEPNEGSHPHLIQGWKRCTRDKARDRIKQECRAYLQGRLSWIDYDQEIESQVTDYQEQFGHTLHVGKSAHVVQ
jgi:hypothetical protein